MKEILFRGKSLDFGDWLCGYIRQYENGKITICDFETKRLWFVKPSTVGQFVGLTDKNGKRIFEGDIVRFSNGKFVVEYYDYRMGFAFKGLFGRGCVPGFTMTDWEHLEVIGNIHDNPELLGGA